MCSAHKYISSSSGKTTHMDASQEWTSRESQRLRTNQKEKSTNVSEISRSLGKAYSFFPSEKVERKSIRCN